MAVEMLVGNMQVYKAPKKGLPAKYWLRVQEVRSAQNFKEFYSRYISGYISVFITAALSYTRITPNHVTLTMFFWGILGGVLLAQGAPFWYLMGSLSLMMLNVADAADGELARYTGTVSKGGDYLDRIAHYVTNAAAILGMGVGLFLQYGELWMLGFAIVVEISHTSDDAARDLLATCGLTDSKKSGGRKVEKLKTSVVKSKKVTSLAQAFATNMAFFHLIGLCALIDLFWLGQHKFGACLIYFLAFGLITFSKLTVRTYKIYRLHFC